jgi:hypothetical protein
MRPRTQLTLVAALLVAVAVASLIKRAVSSRQSGHTGTGAPGVTAPDVKHLTRQSNTFIAAPAAAPRVIAYYFHGTVRCESCLLIEQQARTVIEQRFGNELAAGRLIWESVNYDLPQNKHFLTDYNLPCPSLVLVRQADGKTEQWRLLGDTWELVRDPPKLSEYVETEVRKVLGGQVNENTPK